MGPKPKKSPGVFQAGLCRRQCFQSFLINALPALGARAVGAVTDSLQSVVDVAKLNFETLLDTARGFVLFFFDNIFIRRPANLFHLGVVVITHRIFLCDAGEFGLKSRPFFLQFLFLRLDKCCVQRLCSVLHTL